MKRTVRLGDVCELRAGVGFPPALQGRTSGRFPFAKVADVSRSARAGSIYLLPPQNFVEDADVDILRTRPFPAGTVAFAKIGEAIRQNHRVLLAQPALLDNNVMGAIPDRKIVDAEYLYRFLRTLDMYQLVQATTVPSLRKSDLAEIPMPLPSMDDQRRTVAILGEADQLRSKRRATLAHLDSLTPSIFESMFGDLELTPRRWPWARFDEIVSDSRIGLVRGSANLGPSLPYPYLRMNAITRRGELQFGDLRRTSASPDEVERYSLTEGDLLFNTRNSRELVGKTALYRSDERCLFNNNLMRIRFRDDLADSEFVAAALRTPPLIRELESRKSGTTNVFAIYYKDLRSLSVPVPPVGLQRVFARCVSGVHAAASTFQRSATEMDSMLASLQHRAFSGTL